jgi:hypothetical protein
MPDCIGTCRQNLFFWGKGKKGKDIPVQAMETHRVVRG